MTKFRTAALIVSLICLAIFPAAGVVWVDEKRDDLVSLIDRSMFQYGITINSVSTRQARSHVDVRPSKIVVDSDTALEFVEQVKLFYQFITQITGIETQVSVAPLVPTLEVNKYFYAGYSARAADNFEGYKSEFVARLRSWIKSFFKNDTDDILWRRLDDNRTVFEGQPLFFNYEYEYVDYGKLIGARQPFILQSTAISRSAIFVSAAPIEGLSADDLRSYVKSFIVQEAFQEFNLMSDVSDRRFQLRSILYDHDFKLGDLTGAARVRERVKNASTGLCPLDVAATIYLADFYGTPINESSARVGLLNFIRCYALSYWHYYTSEADLFDSRCW